MEQEHLNTGAYAFDPAADNLKDAMQKVENNFTQLFDVAQNLNDQVSPPVILKITKELHCRPDKGGLYLIDRKQKGQSKAYIQRYNLHFGKVNLGERRPYGDNDLTFLDGVEQEDYHFTDCRLQADTNLAFWTGVITVDPSKPVSFRFTSYTLSTISLFITDINDDGEWYEEFHNISSTGSIWDRDLYTFTLPNGISSFRIYVYMEEPNSINTLIVRQELVIPEERIKADKRFVLAKWTGSEWVFPTVPNGAEIPIKGKSTYFKTGKLITPAVNFPKLLNTKIDKWKNPESPIYPNNDFETTLFFIFDRQLEEDEFGFIFSRYKTAKSVKRSSDMQLLGPKRGASYYHYKSKSFKKYNEPEHITVPLRGYRKILDNNLLKTYIGTDIIRISNTVIMSLPDFIYSFLRYESSVERYVPYEYRHRRKVVACRHGYYHIPLGFQLFKVVDGKRVFGELYKVRLHFGEGSPMPTKFSVGK